MSYLLGLAVERGDADMLVFEVDSDEIASAGPSLARTGKGGRKGAGDI